MREFEGQLQTVGVPCRRPDSKTEAMRVGVKPGDFGTTAAVSRCSSLMYETVVNQVFTAANVPHTRCLG